MNYGVLPGRQQTDWVAGVSSAVGYEVRNPSGNWTPYLPSEERQRDYDTDTMACVSFSLLNCIETQARFFGFDLNYSDRFLAKMSGTTPNGNYLFKVAETLRNQGVVFQERWPTPASYTWDEFYSEIPSEIQTEAKRFLDFWDIRWEWVDPTPENLKHHLKHAPLQIVIPGHAVMGFYQESDITNYFDTYSPYQKKTRTSRLTDALKLVITPKNMNQAKIVKSKKSDTVYWAYPMPSMEYLYEKASLEGLTVPGTIPDSDSL